MSSFYKLASQMLDMCRSTEYFNNASINSVNNLKVDVAKYLQAVLKKCLNFQDELLLSCLNLIVNIPNQFLDDGGLLLAHLPAVMDQVFQLGLSVLPLADKGLDAVSRWMDHCGQDAMGPVLEKVIPRLRSFLATDYDVPSLDGAELRPELEKRKIKRGPLR